MKRKFAVTFFALLILLLVFSLYNSINDLHVAVLPSSTPLATRTPTTQPVSTNTPEPIIATIERGVSIRSGNDKNAEKIGYAKPGETYFVVTPFYNRTKWHQIKYDGIYAFVFADYCALSQDIIMPTPDPTTIPGLTASNPIAVSAENLSKAVAKDIAVAKSTYCWRYVRLAGTILENSAYRTRSYDGKRNTYSYEDHVIYWFINNEFHTRSELLPIKVIMRDVSVCHGKGNKIEIIGYVTSIDEHAIVVERANYASDY